MKFYTMAFDYTFECDDDTVFFAFHYPYTYTYLQEFLSRLEAQVRVAKLPPPGGASKGLLSIENGVGGKD